MEATQARAAVERAANRFTQLLRSAPDPSARVRGSEWTVAEVGAHVLTGAQSYLEYAQGATKPLIHVANVNADNARNLASTTERDISALTRNIDATTKSLLAAISVVDVGEPMRWHDVSATVGAVLGIYLAELLVHGNDVARTIGRPWPVSRPDASIVLEGMSEVARWFVDADRARTDAVVEVNAWGGPTLTFRFRGGALDVRRGRAARPDCRIWGDPRALMFLLYKRTSQWSEIARGRLLAAGRRPWLAFSFVDRFGGY